PVFSGKYFKNSEKALSPPREAPTATTGKVPLLIFLYERIFLFPATGFFFIYEKELKTMHASAS
ncbi:MAG: hypothetical protein ACXVED_15160, partial [Bacteroidia bacterium]